MIFVIMLFSQDNIRINFLEQFIGCNVVPNTPTDKYLGPRTNFNIDEMCNNEEEKKWIQWPCYWRKNYNKFQPKDIGGEGLYNEMKNVGYHEPFKYDGIYEMNNVKGVKCKWS